MNNKQFAVQLFIFIFSLSMLGQSNSDFESKFTVAHLKSAPVKLIPFPQEYKWQDGYLNLSEVTIDSKEISNQNTVVLSELKSILSANNIKVLANASAFITFKKDKKIKDEGYKLKVAKKGISIASSSESGRFYALQTLRQLIDNAQVPFVDISDWPQHAFRGYMIDVGRNYQSMESLKKQLNIMAAYKLNKFHWHLTDRPAWRIESKLYPELTYSNNHRQTRDPGIYYTYDEIREIFKYAKDRHIQVIPEIDMPGHSDSFVTSTGVKMESEKGMEILEGVLNEFFTEIPQEDCPIIHIGSDEVKIPNPKGFIAAMVKICKDANREVVVWHPGLEVDDDVIHQTWIAEDVKPGNFREIDSWHNYVNGAEPMMQIQRLFFRPIGFPSVNNVIGGTLCFWPDVNLKHESETFEQNPVYSSMLTYAWTTWTADLAKGYPEYYTKMPSKDTKALDYYSAFEDIILYHKEKYFSNEPFPYFRQNDKEWQLIGPFNGDDGDVILKEMKETYNYGDTILSWKNAIGNTIVMKERWMLTGHFEDAKVGQTVYAMTYIHSDENREIEAMIGFETALRANKIYLGVPKIGSWDPAGGNIWVNNNPVAPPLWENAGWKPSKQTGWGSKVDQEIPWEEQDFYWTRTPTKIQLNKGWNTVFVKIPRATTYQNWMFTFIPTDMSGLRFSPDKN
ncbi:family 20 glycosylhydrolase [Hwangdonia sp.]|uniref:family 20 glycosylhydrolase n=1 Tax=Hwangdonia sp. TaxID=1883432 RepID=UPI003AB430FC